MVIFAIFIMEIEHYYISDFLQLDSLQLRYM